MEALLRYLEVNKNKIKILLKLIIILKSYEKKDPTCEEENETFLNVVDCLCLLLVKKGAQENFRSSNGI